ncbi:SAM-dependent methyltransferase [Microbacterium sp. Root61]|uniref:class I SAM-dependent methyltransferase n=1 Tax=Microbacterium sp. Root61 TaxID=1736570 RepID=UPI0006F6E61F|nr:class I SAM-dependent methyltransferase [Microbacterium sp. Root61]KRA24354.1 SAM-dependent methyltransferase [Microbacterium sp. Root61]
MSFDVAASAYDRFMGRYSGPLGIAFADWVGLASATRVLDVGCGPGALTTVLVERLGPSAVSAVDPSEPFVAAARSRMPGVDVRLASAEDLPYGDDVFDASLAALVVHFMRDPPRGVSEMVRVTRPGGTVAACVWDFVGGRAPQTLFFTALAEVLPGLDDETRRSGAARGQLVDLLTAAGCRRVEETAVTVAVDYPGFDEWWEPYTLGVAPAGRQLAALDPAQREVVRERCRTLMPDAPFTISATAWAARGIV